MTAINTSSSTNSPAATATCCLRNLRQNSLQGVRTDDASGARTASMTGIGSVSASMLCRIASESMGLPIPYGRIDHRVQHVDDQVDENEFERKEQHLRLDDRIVAHVHRIDQQAAHSRPVEDHLDHDGPAEQETELQPHHGDHGDERVT